MHCFLAHPITFNLQLDETLMAQPEETMLIVEDEELSRPKPKSL
ncbi:hypothetical protein ACFL0Q_06225 [Thermodesulfobacteriota bacterium]